MMSYVFLVLVWIRCIHVYGLLAVNVGIYCFGGVLGHGCFLWLLFVKWIFS
jgi:hypothetical protein